nr:hypothetical protein [Streptomyces sp. V3I7]
MVGLFWITPEAVYVGSPPAVDGHCVLLTTEGVEAEYLDGSRTWAWGDVRSAVVVDVPGRRLGSALEARVRQDEDPPRMTLRLETPYGTEELPVFSAAGGYGQEETALSEALLARFVAGTADPRTLVEWGREHRLEHPPKERVREDLLRGWVEA